MKLNPYLTFNGNCEAAINFYKDVLDGDISIMSRFEDAPPGEFPIPDSAKLAPNTSIMIKKQPFSSFLKRIGIHSGISSLVYAQVVELQL